MFINSIKLMGQFALIMVYFYLGNYVSSVLAPWFFIPGSIWGMILLFVSMLIGLIKVTYIEEVSQFFLKNMGFFFIPLGVSLVDSYVEIKGTWWQLTLILIVSNILVMGFTAKLVDRIIERRIKRQGEM